MAPHFSTLAWKIPWTEEPGRLESMGSLSVGHNWVTSLSLSCIGEGNGNPLQYSCLENPRDGGGWWAAIYGVAQSRTRLKWLSNSSTPVHIIEWVSEQANICGICQFVWNFVLLCDISLVNPFSHHLICLLGTCCYLIWSSCIQWYKILPFLF